MATLPNGLETIESGSTVWRLICNKNAVLLDPMLGAYDDAENDKEDGFTLLNGWTLYNSSEDVTVYYSDTFGGGYIVTLSARIKDGSSGASALTLPSDYRPPRDLFFPISANGTFGEVKITPSGDVIVTATDVTDVRITATYLVL